MPIDPTTMTTLVDPAYWAAAPRELSEVLRVALGAPAPTVPSEPRTAPGAGPATQERLTLTVEEAAQALGISRASAYEAVRIHQVPSVRIGKRILVPRKALERMLDTGDAGKGSESR
jgi:excisionase family DNA binding protein